MSFDFTTPTEEEETEQNVEEDDEEEEEIGTGPWRVKGTGIRQSPCVELELGQDQEWSWRQQASREKADR